MHIALLADIHGNLPALQTVMEFIRKIGVDHTVFLGDYSFGLPFVNETASLVCSVPHASAVRGNGEDRLLLLAKQDQTRWTDGQMRAAYWTIRNLSRQTLACFDAMPDTACVEEGTAPVYAAHKLLRMTGVDESPEGMVPAELPEGLPEGVYVFGHTHRPWHVRRGNVLLVNPGSVGLPMDGTPKAAFAILTDRNDTWQVEQYRIPYDVEAVASALIASPLREAAPVWADLAVRELRTAREHVYPFLAWAERYAQQIGDSRRPYAPDTWEEAYRAWLVDRESYIER